MKRVSLFLMALMIPMVFGVGTGLAVVGDEEKIIGPLPGAASVSIPRIRDIAPPAGACSAVLLAGQHWEVGAVQVWRDLTNLYVRYSTSDGWALSSTHLHLAANPNDFPMANGNPIPGQFKYKRTHWPYVSQYTFVIPWTTVPVGGGGCTYIAAHAKVSKGATISILQGPTLGGPAYFPVVALTEASPLDGRYKGWCVDTDHSIDLQTEYCVRVFSSYDPAGQALVEHPENLDLVNWIINQDYVGKSSTCGGNYTYGDVQRAIWSLIEDNQSTAGLGPWEQCRVDEIVAAAQANGEGFIPCCRSDCRQKLALILQPVDCTTGEPLPNQIIIIEGRCKFDGYETAWGAEECSTSATGYCIPFPGKNWAYYFHCCPVPGP